MRPMLPHGQRKRQFDRSFHAREPVTCLLAGHIIDAVVAEIMPDIVRLKNWIFDLRNEFAIAGMFRAMDGFA